MANDSRFKKEQDQILSQGYEDVHFDGELPAHVLAEFPALQPEEQKKLRSGFTDTHHNSISRRYPNHRPTTDSQPRFSRADRSRRPSADLWSSEPDTPSSGRAYNDDRHPGQRTTPQLETQNVRESTGAEWVLALALSLIFLCMVVILATV